MPNSDFILTIPVGELTVDDFGLLLERMAPVIPDIADSAAVTVTETIRRAEGGLACVG